jgi:hypothetical protein
MPINLALVEMSRKGGVGTQKVSGHKPNRKSFRGRGAIFVGARVRCLIIWWCVD